MLLPGLTHTGVHTSNPFVITVSAGIIYELRSNQKYASQTSDPTLHRLTAHSKVGRPTKVRQSTSKAEKYAHNILTCMAAHTQVYVAW